ncbi:hypothetical protein EON63_01105 [archaeon]|nr:MAG: hypothetical protein EON63_01105 [archaeon]
MHVIALSSHTYPLLRIHIRIHIHIYIYIHPGFWTGRKILGIHLAVLITVFVMEVYVLNVALSSVQEYQIVYKEMDENPGSQPPYVTYESFISDKFNRFFFGASTECSRK